MQLILFIAFACFPFLTSIFSGNDKIRNKFQTVTGSKPVLFITFWHFFVSIHLKIFTVQAASKSLKLYFTVNFRNKH